MSDKINDLPVSAIVRIRPKPGFKKDAFNWFKTFSDAAARFTGYINSDIFESIAKSSEPELAIITHFDTYEHSMLWETSAERKEQIERSRILFEDVKPHIRIAGLEYWFEEAKAKPSGPPPKWKMFIITVVVIYTLFNTLIPLLRGIFNRVGLPPVFHSLFSLVLMVTLMTYLIMPFTTKLLAGWLYKQK